MNYGKEKYDKENHGTFIISNGGHYGVKGDLSELLSM